MAGNMGFPGQAVRHPRLARANGTMGTRGTRGTKYFRPLKIKGLDGGAVWRELGVGISTEAGNLAEKGRRLERKALATRHLCWMSTRRQTLTPELQWRLWRC